VNPCDCEFGRYVIVLTGDSSAKLEFAVCVRLALNLAELLLKGTLALVTGGAGFIGSHLVRGWLTPGRKYASWINLSTGQFSRFAGIERKIDFQEGDIRTPWLAGTPAAASNRSSTSPPTFPCRVGTRPYNVGRSQHFGYAQPIDGGPRFRCGQIRILVVERRLWRRGNPANSRNIASATGEPIWHREIVRRTYVAALLRPIWPPRHSPRYFNVYGPGQNPESEYAAVIPKFITMLLDGKTPTIFGDGEQTRDLLYVGDVVRANLLAAAGEQPAGSVFKRGGRKERLAE